MLKKLKLINILNYLVEHFLNYSCVYNCTMFVSGASDPGVFFMLFNWLF